MTLTTDSTATATLSGRELALKRRKAMALHGKAGVTKTASVMSARPAASRVEPVAAPAAATASLSAGASVSASEASILAQARAAVAANGRSASRARREALSTAGKAALQPTASRPSGRVRQKPQAAVYSTPLAAASAAGCGRGCNGAKGGCGDTSAAASVMPAAAVSPASDIPKKATEPTGRALARARRAELSQDGKAGLKRVAQATKIASSMPGQDWQAAITKGATGRQKAMQRRVVQSLAAA